MSITALSSWTAGRASPRPSSWVRIPRDATLCVFPCKRFTEVPHHHTAISPDTVARVASIWRGFAPTAHYLGPHCRATMPPSCWLTSSPHLVGLRPDGAFPCFNGATLACLHLNVLLGRLVAGLGGASPRLRRVSGLGGASPRLRFGEGNFERVDTTFGFRKPSWDLRRLDLELPGGSFSTPEGSPGPPRASPDPPRRLSDSGATDGGPFTQANRGHLRSLSTKVTPPPLRDHVLTPIPRLPSYEVD